MRRALAVIVLLPFLNATADARQSTGQACASVEHRQFDFWVGNWEVTDSAGTTVYGTNQVDSEEDHCLVHENWAGSRGGTGQSLNFYDPLERRWNQVWVGSDGLVLRISGHLDGASMVLEGDGMGPGGTAVKQRAAWTPQPDGRVRQFWQQSSDGGATWKVAFDGWYRRRS